MTDIPPHKDTQQYLLGIDSGLTITKAAIFTIEGRQIGVGSTKPHTYTPNPRWVEHDMVEVWEACVQAIRQAMENAGIDGSQIVGVGATAHGDGIYLIDENGEPVRRGITSLDSRAWEIMEKWRGDSRLMSAALEITGQQPFVANPTALLAWIKLNEPVNYHRTRWAIFCKDWIKYKLTDQVSTDPTEASVAFTNIHTQTYDSRAFELYGLEEIDQKKPHIVPSYAIAGFVTSQAARETGLREGTPVVTGLHDVDACAVGTGCIHPGDLSVIAGTYSINEVISSEPVIHPGWSCRNFLLPRQWMSMSISPASATNLEWFVRELCAAEVEKAKLSGLSPFEFVNREIEEILEEDSRIYFLPFIYGSPHGDQASAAFIGLRGWHRRAHMLKAIYEGVVFNHKTHVDLLCSGFPIKKVSLSGGGAKSELWSQMFADALNLPIQVTDADEAGALGVAICAGIGAGVYSDLEDAVSKTVRVLRTHLPDPVRHAQLAKNYETYLEIIQSIHPVWPSIG